MSTHISAKLDADITYVSTGHLPEPDNVLALVAEAHARYKSNDEGQNSQVYPALARVPSDLFGICVVGNSGRVYGAGAEGSWEMTEGAAIAAAR